MPQIKIRGISVDKICSFSKKLIDDLEQVVGCPRDYFTIECIHSTYIFDGQVVPSYPFIEVEWFDRGQETQDKVAKVITSHVQDAGFSSVDVSFNIFKKNSYYENGEHF